MPPCPFRDRVHAFLLLSWISVVIHVCTFTAASQALLYYGIATGAVMSEMTDGDDRLLDDCAAAKAKVKMTPALAEILGGLSRFTRKTADLANNN